MCTNENEKLCFNYENFNQKYLTNGGVCLYFSNVFDQTGKGKFLTIKHKLRKILVDFGMCQTFMEINQRLNFIKVWYVDEQAIELKELFVPLRNDNKTKESQAIELNINLEDSLVTPPDKGKIKTYTGLTMLIYQEFIQPIESRSLVDDNPFNEMKEIIKQGNLSPTEPLSAILVEGVD